MYKSRKITVIIPALNEEQSIAKVVNGLFDLRVCSHCLNIIDDEPQSTLAYTDCADDSQTQATPPVNVARLDTNGATRCLGQCQGVAVVDQIVVGDNGSTDNTAVLAKSCGAVVVDEPNRGYGAACLAAIAAPVEKDIIVFVDGDHSVVPQELPALISPLFDGADLVIGSRTLGHRDKGALSLPQEIGNRLATTLLRQLWGGNVTDLGPFRATTMTTLAAMQMRDRKFGWTVEMQIRALQLSLNTVEVPVSTRQRIGKSKISGTFLGVMGAAHGILGTIGKLYWRQIRGAYSQVKTNRTYSPTSSLNEDLDKSS